jgi:DNA-binding CsgD family transcriptional regulator
LSIQAAVGHARRGRGPRQRPDHGWDSLTPTQRQVVQLVAEGLPDPGIASRLFISRATVKTHLARVLTKLDVINRAQLVALAAQAAPEDTLGRGWRTSAAPLAARTRRELLATGARPRRTALTSPDALTSSERRVAGLAADGLSNRQTAQHLFITQPTVETHLRHSFHKLGITSRADLPAQLDRELPTVTGLPA